MSSSINPSPQVGAVRLGQDHRSVARSVVTLRATLRFADRLQLIQGTICDLSVGGAGFICTQDVAATTRCTRR